MLYIKTDYSDNPLIIPNKEYPVQDMIIVNETPIGGCIQLDTERFVKFQDCYHLNGNSWELIYK